MKPFKRFLLFFYLCLIAQLIAQSPKPAITVVESGMRATLGASSFLVAVPILNGSPTTASVKLELELLGAEDQVLATAAAERLVKPGPNQFKLDLQTKPLSREPKFPWYRVRYRLSSGSAITGQGILALGAIAPDLFDVTVASPRMGQVGRPYVLHVHAFNPVVHRPVGGVSLIASYDHGGGKNSVTKVTAVTNSSGDADLTFTPQALSDSEDDQEIKLEARKGPLSYDRDIDFSVDSRLQILLQTDKPLYQARQTIHLRSLSFAADRRAVAGQKITFSMEDPENNVVFKAEAATNKYGIAAVDWPIPDSVRLGDYGIKAEADDSRNENTGYASVRISQYDLPSFTVKAAGDRGFYLPNENAVVEITAGYLFGQPVPGATVRVIPAPQGKWDWRSQKWEPEPGEEIQGTLDQNGKLKLPIDLEKAQQEFKESGYQRFRDLEYLLQATDPSTGKSERARFTLRLSHQHLHVYVIGSAMPEKNTASFYLATYYPDGTPAPAQVQISQLEGNQAAAPGAVRGEQVLRTVKTNRYGLAKVEALPLADTERNDAVLLFVAHDAKGKTGRQTEELWSRNQPFVAVAANKTLYREGDPVEVTLRCPSCSGNFHVEILQQESVIASQKAHLKHGSAFLVFPYERQFHDELTIVAYPTDAPDDEYSAMGPGSHTILFPRDSELKLAVGLDRETYRPAGEMNASIRLRSSDGAWQQGALGVLLVDKAVEERAREDGIYLGEHWWNFRQDQGGVGGITRHDLDQVDLSQPLPDGFDLAAEIILNGEPGYYRPKISGGDYSSQTIDVFQNLIEKQLSPLFTALSCSGLPRCDFPGDAAGLERILEHNKAALAELRDPWGTPFRIQTSIEYAQRIVTVISAGPDKRFDTDDDFTARRFSWNYFNSIGNAIDAAVKEAHARSDGFIHDYASLRRELLPAGLDLDSLRDPWNNPYVFEFTISGSRLQIIVRTRGADGSGTFPLWTTSINYFDRVKEKIDQALGRYLREKGRFPADETTFRAAMAYSSIAFDQLRDPWGNPYYLTFKRLPESGASVVVRKPGAWTQVEEHPVARVMDWIWINSAGPDSSPHSGDDFAEASFSHALSAENADFSVQSQTDLTYSDLTGAIEGLVVDQQGAVIAGASVTATRVSDSTKYTATTTSEGRYLLRNLPAGLYSVQISARAFQTSVIQDVPVHSSSLTQVNATLIVGTTTEVVEVTAAAPLIETTQTHVASVKGLALPSAQIHVPTSTPHLREYFPETLYWQPSLITDGHGNASLTVKLADTITTWKLVAFASTEDGRMGVAEKDIVAFQPFFAEHDPPRILTLGDEISLPIIVRNYLKKSQSVDVSMKPASWFSLLGPERQKVTVKQNDAARAVFQIHAGESIEDGKQQVSAVSDDAGDAVEKPVTVHPYGEKRYSVVNQVAGASAVQLEIPANAIAGSLRAQLRIYPNLMAHVIESVEAGLHRPYGCGEQTISSTYPSLMVVKYYSGEHTQPAIAAVAQRYLRQGYERLLRYQEPGGGFSYWGHGDPNISLTAYALRFLTEASRLQEMDRRVISSALAWLVQQQKADGSWQSDERLTGYVLWTLADLHLPPAENDAKLINGSLTKGLNYLTERARVASDPYTDALSVLALVQAGHRDTAAPIVERLSKAAQVQNGIAWWELSGGTLFHSWGLPGRLEVTSVALRALHAFYSPSSENPQHELINRGLLYLARSQDHYGVWYSGQTTWNVLNTMLELAGKSSQDGEPVEAAILVNGKTVSTVQVPQKREATGPLYLDLSSYLAAGRNTVEIQAARSLILAGAQVASTYYVPWPRSSDGEARKPGIQLPLSLAVHFDKTQAHPGEPIDCQVEVARLGREGWGMLLAEIGVPPGADVDRASLDRAVSASGWELSHYDVMPDRIVLYVWPRSGGTKFHFTFKPRFEMRAYSAPSTLYDYYNPEAYAVVPPEMFRITAAQPAAVAGNTMAK